MRVICMVSSMSLKTLNNQSLALSSGSNISIGTYRSRTLLACLRSFSRTALLDESSLSSSSVLLFTQIGETKTML